MYKCPTCGQCAPEPPVLEAKRKGFDEFKHCRILAHKKGRIVDCCMIKVGKPQFCESFCCPIAKAYSKIITDKFGRTKEVYFDPEVLAKKVNL
ncbi:MAG: hypothetical protein WC511_02850 [Candidatus Pacearchaeota archaeon]